MGQISTRCCKSYRLSAELEWQLCLAKLIIPQTSSYCITCIYTDTSNTYSKAYHAMDRLARTKSKACEQVRVSRPELTKTSQLVGRKAQKGNRVLDFLVKTLTLDISRLAQ